MNNYEVEIERKSVPVDKIIEKHVDVDKFLNFCKSCPIYGSRWACPPFSFDVLEYWKKFKTLDIFMLKIKYPNDLRSLENEIQKKQGMLIISKEKIKMLDKLYELENALPGSRALSAGMCELCETEGGCTRPGNKPCRHPEHMRFSIEALGGDIIGILKDYFNTDVLWTSDGSLPEYHTIVFGLLSK